MTAADSAPALRRWADLVWTDFAALDPTRTVAVLPLGATEQHGPHLPLAVDTAIVEALLGAAAAHLPPDAPLLVLPTLAVGLSPEHEAFPGTLSLAPETALAVLRDVAAGVARAGVRKMVIVNGHGGHVGLLDVATRAMRVRHGLLVWSVPWWQLPLIETDGRDLLADLPPEEQRFGVHAGQLETAVMLAIAPERVRRAALRTFASSSQQRAQRYPLLGNGRSAKLAWCMQDLHPEGAAGDAAAADADWGRRVLAAAGASLAQLLQEAMAVPLSTVQEGPCER
ncbi:MAG: creatininase family protein [Tepidimonas sp.]|uniref:creatininase family protein n=1 Tax=Tepidimonas sp. TaxID=2002775 RepID=UPI00298ED0FF|nr:creatininase family protein [Tepidimonas sp.]MCS6810414.1 creatininase family protein [Tepidimonas sp.]MDW8335549.1 creatininase family protein [Tepidimonas sp.]